jgi:hypothetical protein
MKLSFLINIIFEEVMIYLYIKTNTKTGLKYFGKTTREDYEVYKGSGVYWANHNNKHGWEYTTEIIAEFEDIKEAKQFAINFSEKNNIVKSHEWANLKVEDISGGWDHINGDMKQFYIEKSKETVLSWDEDYRNSVNKSKSMPGDKNPMYGKDRSGEKNPRYGVKVKGTETAKKIGDSNRGKTRSDEVKQKRSKKTKMMWEAGVFDKRKKLSKDQIKNWTQSSVGTKWWNNGTECKRSKESPGVKWVLGRIKTKI